jgi:predicted nucleotidyltransferase
MDSLPFSTAPPSRAILPTVDSGRIRETLSGYLASHPDGLVAAYLYGSVARGTATSRSDVDVGLLYAEAPESRLEAQPFPIEGDLQQLLNLPVHVVVMNGAPPDLVHRILRDSVLVLETDRSARVAFEVRLRNEYFDLQPILHRYRRRAAAGHDGR